MITTEHRIDLLAKIAASYNSDASTGVSTAPRVWYLDHDRFARDASVIAFWKDRPVLVSGDQPFMMLPENVFASREEAIIESAESQKRELDRLHAEYIATCKSAHEFIGLERKRRLAEKK